MIPKPKLRSFRSYLIFFLSLLTLLVGIFVYAVHNEARFFFPLSITLLINIIILLGLYRRLKHKRSDVKLQKEEFFEKANLLRSDLEHEEHVIDAFRQKIVAYSRLKGLTEQLSLSLSVEDTVQTLVHETAQLFGDGPFAVLLYLIDPHTGELAIALAESGQSAINVKMKQGDLFDRWIMKTMQPLCLEDAKDDFRFDTEEGQNEIGREVRSLAGVPLMVHDKTVGILRVDSAEPGRFTKDDLRFLMTIGDIAAVAIDNAQLFDRVEDLAIRDGLTGLYLRRYLMDRFREEIDRHLRKGKELTFLMFDLDHFKRYNDHFGHMAGDIVLRHIGKMLQKHFHEPGDLLCRYGGEEFCVVLPECSKKQAVALAEGFVKEVDKKDIVLRREKTHMTVSVGVASFPKDAKIMDDLIGKADEALYKAKKKGRNRVVAA